jgi:hypothetical protein
MTETWTYKVVEDAKTVTVDDSNPENPVLLVPSYLEEETKKFFAETETENWFKIWETFRYYGLLHPRHGRWHQSFNDMEEKGLCCQYIVDGFSKFFMQKAPSNGMISEQIL